MKNFRIFIASTIIFTQVLWSTNGYANPSGGVVVQGSGAATFDTSVPNTLTVNQTTGKVVINWPSFSIAANETTKFVQPSSTSVALNRVTGASPSNIYGTLSSNGIVFLINQNGILFGKGSHVNVGGLIASTLNITDSEFALASYPSMVKGNPVVVAGYYFIGAGGFGSVINQGTISINAPGGYAALLGSNVENTGAIMTTSGSVAMAAGNEIAVNLDSSGSISAVIVPQELTNNSPANVNAVFNSGTLTANGGEVILTAQSLKGLFMNLVNNAGIIEAHGIIIDANDHIVLTGTLSAGTGNILPSGTVDISITGGNIDIDYATITSTAINDNALISIQYDGGINIINSRLLATSTMTVGPPASFAGIYIQGNGVADIVNSKLSAVLNSTIVTAGIINGLMTNGTDLDINSYLNNAGESGVIINNSQLTSSVNGASSNSTNSITAQTNSNLLNGNIQFINGSTVQTNQAGAGFENLTISGENITGDSTSSISVDGTLFLNAIGDIGSAAQALNINVGTVSGGSTGIGDIYLNSLNAVTLSSLSAADGLINVVSDGQITADNVTAAGGSALDGISLTTSFGDIDVGSITAAGLGSVTLNSAGNIYDINGFSMITSNNLTLESGITGSSVGEQLYLATANLSTSVVGGYQELTIKNQPGAAGYDVYFIAYNNLLQPIGTWQMETNVPASTGSTTVWTDLNRPAILNGVASYYVVINTAATSNIGSLTGPINTNVNAVSGISHDIGAVYLNQGKSVLIRNLQSSNGLINVISMGDMTIDNLNAAGDVFLDSVNGSITGAGAGTNITSAGDVQLTAGNLIGSWSPYSPLNINVGGDLYLSIAQRDASALGSAGTMGVSGTLAGTVGGAIHFAPGTNAPYNSVNSVFTGNPPGYIFLNSTEIWPRLNLPPIGALANNNTLADAQLVNALQPNQSVYYEKQRRHLIRPDEIAAPLNIDAYHATLSNNSFAVDHTRPEPEAYDYIDARINLSKPVIPGIPAASQKQQK